MSLFKSVFTPYLQEIVLVMNNQHNQGQSCHQDEDAFFDDISQLDKWLVQQGINTNVWGQGSTKTVKTFWHELVQGDSSLQLSPPLRRVHVAQILIRKNGRVLIESVQEFGNGRRRFRNQVPSEKMRPNEPFLEAAVRCLYKELGIAANQITFDEATYSEIEIVTDSISYPGLPTQYTFHRMEASVAGLPGEDFWHENASYNQGDPIKRHFWVWQNFTGTAPGAFE